MIPLTLSYYICESLFSKGCEMTFINIDDNRKGILLHRSNKRIEAMDALIKSLNSYPYNWSAWLMLGDCIQDIDDVCIF